jgi:hypothetical protein
MFVNKTTVYAFEPPEMLASDLYSDVYGSILDLN